MSENAPNQTVRGVQIFDGFLDPEAQQQMVEDLRAVARTAPFFQPVTPRGQKMSVRMTAAGRFGWISDRGGYRYAEQHPNGQVWPEIAQGMREVGIIDMEIYIQGTTLFMIMDTVADFDHEEAFKVLATKPRQAEWEAHMAQFQDSSAEASADEKWQLMERIFELDQQTAYAAIDGQQKELQ